MHPSEKIKSKARELGFAKVGIARAEELTAERGRLRDWLNRGYHATMDWMARNADKRADPGLVLPNAKSVLCVAMNYYTDVRHSNDPAVGKISRYAWGDDYHIILTERLEQLRTFIKTEIPGVNARIYVDTGPVMDKAWAVRSGIGWLGKHTNVITKELGSWVFLGEIILDAELEYDSPIEDFCGSCTACIEACPTGAITQEYVVDSNKCLSYLTIEHRGEIDDKLKPKFEGWIYGCDICQDVCPWNRFQQETKEPAFRARDGAVTPNLETVGTMTKDQFSSTFRKSPVKRTKWEGLMRNVAIVKDHLT